MSRPAAGTEFEPHPVQQFIRSIRTGPTRIPWAEVPKDLRKIAIWAIPVVAFTLLVLFVPIGHYEIDHREVTRDQFVAEAGPLMAIFCVFLLVTAYGIRTERRWVRPVALAGIIAMEIFQAAVNGFQLSPFLWIVLTIPVVSAVWFWCFKKEVAEYYRRLAGFG